MSFRDGAAGYPGVDGFFIKPTLTDVIVYSYHDCALTPKLARSDFLRDEDILCGSRVIFGREQEIEFFGYDTDDNEDPPVNYGPRILPDSMTICQHRKFQVKLSDIDKRLMCDNFNKWVEILSRQVDKDIVRIIDDYSIPLILASASPDNVGKNAGMLNHSVDLGGTGGTGNAPLSVTTADEFERLVDNFIEVSSQAGWFCDSMETANLGDGVASPVMVLPSKLRPFALKYIKEHELGCNCSSGAAFRSGQIGVIHGMDVIVTQKLQPIKLQNGATLATPFVCDPNQILHAFEVISNKVWEGKFEEFYTGQFVYDTYVVNPYGVTVANVQLS